VARVKSLADWPLQASLPAAAGTAPFDPSTTWTIVAGGDVMFDRGVYKVVKLEGKASITRSPAGPPRSPAATAAHRGTG